MNLKPTKKKTVAFIILLIIIELMFFWFGATSIQCAPCAGPPAYCPPCISYGSGLYMVLLTILPIALLLYIVLSAFSGKPAKKQGK